MSNKTSIFFINPIRGTGNGDIYKLELDEVDEETINDPKADVCGSNRYGDYTIPRSNISAICRMASRS